MNEPPVVNTADDVEFTPPELAQDYSDLFLDLESDGDGE